MMNALWKKRAYRFWHETAPYFRYAMMGGLTTTFVLLFLVGGYGYARLLQYFPPNFPYIWVLLILFILCIYPAHVRTYLVRADLVHLLPFESQISAYLRPAFATAYVRHTLFILLIAVLALPVYKAGRLSEGIAVLFPQMAVMAIALLVMKWFSIYACWKEGQFRDIETRQFYRCLRTAVVAVFLYLLLTAPLALSVLIGSVLLLVHLYLLRKPKSYSFHWEYFVHADERAKERIYTFLSWFVDVPESDRGLKRRRLLNIVDRWIVPNQKNAYYYLYWKFFQRSELSRIVFRLTLAGILFVWVLSDPLWKLGAFLFFAVLIAAQLSSLYSYHLHLVWVQVYPLAENLRSRSAAVTAWLIYCTAVAMIITPLLILSTGAILGWISLAGLIVLAIAYRYFNRKAVHTFTPK